MGKYDPLCAYLRRQKADAVDLSFGDIERKLGAFLPKAALGDSWWRPGGGVQTQAWTEAGFEAAPALKTERVLFTRRIAQPASPDQLP